MSRDDAAVVMPPACAPAWEDIPALAWVAARAYCPERAPAPLARVLAACSLLAWLAWLPCLVSLHARGRLAANGRRAVVAVEGLNNPRALMWVLGALVLMLVGGSVVIWLELGAGGYLGAVTVASPWLVPLVVLRPWRIIRAQPAIWRVYDELRDSDPDAPVYQLGALAAWPRGQRHGSSLLTALLEVAPVDGFVVAYPRSSELRDWYVRLGMIEHSGGALYLDLRKDRGVTRRRRSRVGRGPRTRSGGRSRGPCRGGERG